MIIASLATIPCRERLLKNTINSLIPQVDYIYVQLNDYKEIPTWLEYESADHNMKVIGSLTSNMAGDANKFWNVENHDGYVFTCDDDLIYPPDYTQTLTNKLQEYDNRVIVTCHGRVFPKGPIESYYADKILSYHCLYEVKQDCLVHVGGTGVMAFHTSTLDIKYSDFQQANMADVWMAKVAYQNYCPIICIEHGEGWIGYQPTPDETIWDRYSRFDEVQTEVINSIL